MTIWLYAGISVH